MTTSSVVLRVVLRGLEEEGRTPHEVIEDIAGLLRVRYGESDNDVRVELIESSSYVSDEDGEPDWSRR